MKEYGVVEIIFIIFLDTNNCDVLCLQETWTIDSNLGIFSNIHNDYLFTCISGIDHTIGIIKGRPHGGVAILYKKSLSNMVTHINTTNRRVCGINIKENNALLIILSFYMPCDNYSTYDVDNTYSECIDFIETLYQSNDCNYFIATGEFNTCFSRDNAHTKCLNNFVNRNNL